MFLMFETENVGSCLVQKLNLGSMATLPPFPLRSGYSPIYPYLWLFITTHLCLVIFVFCEIVGKLFNYINQFFEKNASLLTE